MLVVFLIAAVVVGVVAIPLLRGRGGASPAVVSRKPDDTASDMPDELAELEQDRAMGRLTEADYLELRERIAAVPRPAPVAEPVPPAAAPRSGAPSAAVQSNADLDARAEAMVAALRASPRSTCGTCGDRPEPGAKYCSTCGTRLGTCPSCGRQPPQAGAQFCSFCGASLAA